MSLSQREKVHRSTRAVEAFALIASILLLGACTPGDAHEESAPRLAASLSALAEQRLSVNMSEWDR